MKRADARKRGKGEGGRGKGEVTLMGRQVQKIGQRYMSGRSLPDLGASSAPAPAPAPAPASVPAPAPAPAPSSPALSSFFSLHREREREREVRARECGKRRWGVPDLGGGLYGATLGAVGCSHVVSLVARFQ
eukprot:3033115-Rhodomonas_salina.2